MEYPRLPDQTTECWVKEPDMCEWLMISRYTFRRWRKQGLPYVGKGRLRRYWWPTLLQWMDRRGDFG